MTTTQRPSSGSALHPPRPPAPVGMIVAALLVVYVVWGSTYLGIRVVVEEAPPMLSMGARFVTAGVLLGGVVALRGGLKRLRVTRREFAGCALIGLFLPVLGNGVVAVGEHAGAPSGIAALLIASAPLIIAILRFASGDRPRALSMVGILLGLVGLIYLVLAGSGSGSHHVPIGASLLVLLASTCWATGSWVQPRLELPRDSFVMTVYEMLTGGVMLLVFGLLRGERADVLSYSGQTWLAWSYLVVFGSMLGFTAYVWLLTAAPISLVATYAYVNPVVAVLLGSLILNEPITRTVLIGGGIIVVAVMIVISVERPRRRVDPDPEPESDPGTVSAETCPPTGG